MARIRPERWHIARDIVRTGTVIGAEVKAALMKNAEELRPAVQTVVAESEENKPAQN